VGRVFAGSKSRRAIGGARQRVWRVIGALGAALAVYLTLNRQRKRGNINLVPADIVQIARAWIDVCELGRSVISEQKPDSEFEVQVRSTILSDLDSALPRARARFGENRRETERTSQ